MDGVLSNFDKWKHTHGGITKENIWTELKKEDHFFLNLEPMPEMEQLMEYLYSLNTPLAILTAIPRRDTIPEAQEDKRKWVRKHLGDIEFNVGPFAINKQRFSGPGLVLIDDNQMNIEQWKKKGGHAIYYTGFEALHKSMERLLKRK